MLGESTESRIRELHQFPLHPDFTVLWQQALVDKDIRSAMSRLLFVPSADPDIDQACVLVDILNALIGERHGLVFYADLETTTATITRVRTTWDADGPHFHVSYRFKVNETGADVEVDHTFSYDGENSPMDGWSAERLECHWRVGKVLTCRYKKNSPAEHAVESPYGWRASPRNARVQTDASA